MVNSTEVGIGHRNKVYFFVVITINSMAKARNPNLTSFQTKIAASVTTERNPRIKFFAIAIYIFAIETEKHTP